MSGIVKQPPKAQFHMRALLNDHVFVAKAPCEPLCCLFFCFIFFVCLFVSRPIQSCRFFLFFISQTNKPVEKTIFELTEGSHHIAGIAQKDSFNTSPGTHKNHFQTFNFHLKVKCSTAEQPIFETFSKLLATAKLAFIGKKKSVLLKLLVFGFITSQILA